MEAIANGNDTGSSHFLKISLPWLENSMAMLFNASIETSIFPDLWKIAKVASFTKKEIKVRNQIIAQYRCCK